MNFDTITLDFIKLELKNITFLLTAQAFCL